MNEHTWIDEPMRISAVQCNYGEDSYDILERHVVGGGFNVEQLLHLNADGHTAFYDHQRDAVKLREYVRRAHDRGIRVILYWNTHCIELRDRDLHPDWVQIDDVGEEVKAYGNKYLICINGGWSEHFYSNLEKVLTIDIDGIFLDGPVINPQGCHCAACRERWRVDTGSELPPPPSAAMRRFKVSSVTDFIRKTHLIKQETAPQVLIYLNNSSLRADITGSNTSEVWPYVEMLGTEAGFAYINKTYELAQMTPKIKYIETLARGKPYVVFTAGDNKPHSYYLHTAAETRILYYRSVACGANIWYGIHAPTWIMNDPGGQAAYACNAFHARHVDCYRRTRSAARIAVLWSQDTANSYASTVAESDFTVHRDIGISLEKGNHALEFDGFCDLLQRFHMQYDVIGESSILAGDLPRYELVILPVAACLSDSVIEALNLFAENGGTVLVTYDSGCYDAEGSFVGPRRMRRLTGVGAIGGFLVNSPGQAIQMVAEGYDRAIDMRVLPGPGKVAECRLDPGSEIISRVSRPMASRYVDFPPMELVLASKRPIGSGCCLYIAGTHGEQLGASHDPQLRRLTADWIRSHSNPLIETDLPQSVEVFVRHQPETGRWFIHLLNITGEMDRPIERILPVRDFNLILRLPERIVDMQALDQALVFTFDPAGQSLHGRELRDYAVLVGRTAGC